MEFGGCKRVLLYKERLIKMLCKKLVENGCTTKQAPDDADRLIIETAISLSSTRTAAIVGEDVHLICLLIALVPEENNIFLIKPGKQNVERRVFSSLELQRHTKLKDNILFLHAFGGCDTTSSLFQKGKMKIFALLQQNPALKDAVKIYSSPNASHEDIASVGERCFLGLYKALPHQIHLHELRYSQYAKSSNGKKVDLASLPPTQEAARQHAFRVYHQVQKRLGNDKSPEDWGWKTTPRDLEPVTTMQDPAPSELLSRISCNCKKGCIGACGCKKVGLKCSILCGTSAGISCSNVPEVCIEEEIEELDNTNYENDDTNDAINGHKVATTETNIDEEVDE